MIVSGHSRGYDAQRKFVDGPDHPSALVLHVCFSTVPDMRAIISGGPCRVHHASSPVLWTSGLQL